MDKLSIVAIRVDNRTHVAPKVQGVLTKYGESIISRFGSHDPGEKDFGLITLHVLSSEDALNELSEELSALDGVEVKTIKMRQK